MSRLEVLVDSDAWVGIFSGKDAHHKEANRIFDILIKQGIEIFTTTAIEGEAATVLSHKEGYRVANDFIHSLDASQIPIVHIDEQLHNRAMEKFLDTNRRGTSYVDLTNVAVMERYNIEKIFSFDKSYFKDFGLKPA
jgi:predicted nucleic acid-binding protein